MTLDKPFFAMRYNINILGARECYTTSSSEWHNYIFLIIDWHVSSSIEISLKFVNDLKNLFLHHHANVHVLWK